MSNATKISVLLVDDHPIFRKGLQSLFEEEQDIEVIGNAGDGETALELIGSLTPDIVVMDITMPGINGIEATKHIGEHFPASKVLALSIHTGRQFVEDMLRAGAVGYVVKESAPEELIKAVRVIADGSMYLSPAITGIVINRFNQSETNEQYQQEQEIEIEQTKLHAPQIPKNHVHRQRLISLLEKNRDLALQTITAPAGYGKSTLVSCWFSMHPWPHAWLSVDEQDNELRAFIAYFIHLVKNLFPHALSKSNTLLQAVQLPPIQVLSKTLANELNRIEQDFILVFDDFHLIGEKNVHDLLSELLRHPPKPLHLIIIGRTDPFLPKSRLYAQGQLAELRLSDLQFSETETAEFFQSRFGQEIDIDKHASKRWRDITEGWVTGLRLAALSIRHPHDLVEKLEGIKGNEQLVREYLFHEVLEKQPENLRHQFLCLSILERFCAPLSETLCPCLGNDCRLDGWSVIKWLKHNNLFLKPLDNEGYWFRFHHLFQELLRNQLERQYNSGQIHALHVKASAWFAANDFLEEAIRHSIAANDLDNAVLLVEQNRHRMLDSDKLFVLEKWLSYFPYEVVQRRAELLLTQCWVGYHKLDYAIIPSIIARIRSLDSQATPDKLLQGEIDFFLGFFHLLVNESEKALQHLQSTLDNVPEIYLEVRGLTEVSYGLASQMQGNMNMAITRLEELFVQHKNDANVTPTRLLITLAFLHFIGGNLQDALIAVKQLYEISRKGRQQYAKTWSFYLQGLIHFHQNDLNQAVTYFRQAADNKYILHARASTDSLIGLNLSYQECGDPEMALAAQKELEEFITSKSDRIYSKIVALAKVRMADKQRTKSHNIKILKKVSAAPENMLWWLENPDVSYCRALLSEDSVESLEEAATRLEELLVTNRANHNVCQSIQILALSTMAYVKQGRDEEALKMLLEAVTLASWGRWVRTFVELGPAMKSLLKRLLERQPELDFIHALLNAFKQEGVTVGVSSVLSNPRISPVVPQPIEVALTEREMEILELLGQRLRNKEIAEILFISAETVKSHLKKIFEKLAVKNRREAISKAVKVGLLSS